MLITTDDIRKHRPISLNLDDEKRLLTYINEAEHLDVMPALGVELYKKVSESPSSYTELLEGGYYADDKRHFAGLKAAVSLLSYARFIKNNAVNATPFGVQRKSALDSNPVDDATLTRHANEAEMVGRAYLQACIDYLNHGQKCASTKQVGQRKFRPVGQ